VLAIARPQEVSLSCRILACSTMTLGALTFGSRLVPAQAAWSISPAPIVSLGGDAGGTREMFAEVYGAARLPSGNILVADNGDFGLRVFSPSGKLVAQYGRKGQGPGELTALNKMFRCGDTIVTVERMSQKVSVFGVDGRFARSFRFGSPGTSMPPYHSTCNANGVFLHFGWYADADLKPGLFRSMVPFWLSGLDAAVRAVIGNFPGSDMQGRIIPGRMRGTSLPLIGRQSVTAIGADRLYIGSADRYEIGVYDFTGKPVGTIRKAAGSPVATSPADVAYARSRRLALVEEQQRPSYENELAGFEIAKTLPAYAAIVLDSDGLVWVQDYPRPGAQATRWSVFTSQGVQRAELMLPANLEVYEIGRDYVLGRYLDPEESVPQVKLYRLQRPNAGS
jgi:hypothetical protein